ncbi:MAG: fatty acid desaturase [Bdellovibrionota bacterium]
MNKKFLDKIGNLNWIAIIYLLSIPVLSVAFLPWALKNHVFTWPIVLYAVVHYAVDCLSITVGYHRLVSHKAYEAHPVVKATMLATGAGAVQNSALIWSRDHRIHHREVDTDNDPYSINKGFWYAHFLWMFEKMPPIDFNKLPPDLKKDKLVRFQHAFYLPIAILVGFGIPMLAGYLLVDSVAAGLYVGAVLRLFASGHCTFAINSFAHLIGTRPYSVTCTARDNWFLSIFTFGEGYHNYHHKFQADYRNGLVWYAWDPSKWIIFTLSKLGLTSNLIRMSEAKVRLAKMEVAEQRLQEKGFDVARLVKERMELLHVHEKIEALKVEIERYREMGRERMDRSEKAVLAAYRTKMHELSQAKKAVIKRWNFEKKLIRSLPRVAI